MSDETKVAAPVYTLTPIECGALSALNVAKIAVGNEMEAYLTNIVCGRLGIHRNRIVAVDTQTGAVTLASDAPKKE